MTRTVFYVPNPRAEGELKKYVSLRNLLIDHYMYYVDASVVLTCEEVNG